MLNWNDIKKQNDYSGKKPNLPTPKATAPKNVPSLQIPGANTVSPWIKSPTAKFPMVNTPITPAPNTKASKESERKNIFQNKVQENWLGKNVSAGLSSFNTSLAKTLDWILPTEIAGRYDIIDPIFNAYKKADEGYQARATEVNDSQTKQIAGTLVSGTVQALPSAIMAVMTGGGSIAGQATTQGLTSASALPNLGKVSKVTKIMEDAVQELGSNPMFWNSFAQMAGPTYEKEIANGASETKASASAMLNGILGSAIEVSGGLETFKWADKGWKQFIRQALEEGGEEVTQYTVENIINKAVGSNDAKWISMDKEQDAVINPKAQAEQGAYGVAIGGILGGGQRGLVKGLNAVSKPKSKVLEQKIAEAKKPVETAKQEPTEAPQTDFYAGRGAISPDIDKAEQLSLPEPKYVDKPGVDKVKSKNDTFKSIVAKINTEDKADRAEIAEIVKTIDRDDWDTNETFDKIVNLVSKQKYADYNPEESYPGLKKDIRETAIQITGDIRQITDFNSLRKKAMGKVKLSKNGKPMDVLYAEWSEMYPDLFPETITHPTEQLEQVIKVSDSLKSTVKTVGDMLSYNEILEGPVTDIYGEILNYRNAVKVVQDQAYQNAKGQREVPKTLVKSELTGNVKAKPLPEVSEKASNQAVEPRKEEPRPIPKPKEVKPLETVVKKEAKDADRERVNIPEERVDRRTAEKLGKLNKFITEEMGRPGGFTISRSKEGNRVKEIARLFGKEAYIVSPTEEGASIFNGVNIGGDIYINDDTINPLHVVFGHEFAHDLRVDHPEGFKKFAEIFAEELDQTKYAKYAKDMQSVSKDTNQEYDYDYILEEMIADFSGEMFNKPEIMARVFEADRGLAKAIHDIIVKILQTVQKTIGRNYIVTDGINDLKRVEDAYVQLVKEARLKDARPDKPGTKFSMKKPVEEVKDLIAVHNLNEAKLLDAIKLGGFPMPSIAVIKANNTHGFGAISMVFSKDTIDPSNPYNKVYGADAWTPTFPDVEYKINSKKQWEIYDLVDSLIGDDVTQSNTFYPALDEGNMAEYAMRNSGDLVSAYKGKDAIKLAYAKSKDPNFKVPTKEKTFGSYDNAFWEMLEKKVGNLEGYEGFSNYLKYEPYVRRNIDEYYEKVGTKFRYKENEMPFNKVDQILMEYKKYQKQKGQQTPDETRLREKLNKLTGNGNGKDYGKWLNDLFDGIIEKTGIRNDVDMFTRSGNRKSFEATHYDVTLENVVKVMRNQAQKGNSGMFIGSGSIIGAVSKDFKSIKDIKDSSDRLQNLSDEELETLHDDLHKRLQNIVRDISSDVEENNYFVKIDNATESLLEVARKRVNTIAGVKRELAKSNMTADDQTAQDILEYMKDASIIPVQYFEAKPQRAVGFDEVVAVVMPKKTSKDIVAKLKEFGVKAVRYDETIEGDRLAKLNSIKNVKFSMKRGMESPIYRDRMEMELAENGEYQEIIKELEGVLYTDDPEIQYLAKHIKDRKGWVLGLKDIYRNMRDAFGDGYQHIKINYLDPFDQSKKDYVDTIKKYTDIVYYDVVKGLGIKKGSRYSKAVQWIGEGQRQMGMKEMKDAITGKTYKVANLIPYTMEDLKKDFPTKWQDIKRASEIMRTVYDHMIDEVNESRRKIYPNNPSKLVPKRKDYFRHYREISSTFEGLWNVFSSSTNIDPKLAGISEFTKPKSRWASFMQERGMGKYKEDAIGGFLDYVGPASYSIHIDPHISRFRGLAKQIAEATGDTKNANDTIAYLHDFANSLAGKTVDWDRFFSKQFGRKPLIVLATLNNRVKKNQILMNLRSALSQVANVPLGIAKIKNPKHLIPGAGDAITYMIGANKSVSEMYSHSQFISERYSHQMLDRFKSSLLDKPELMASWLIESADQMGTMFIWNSAYRSAVDKQVMNPTKYADDVTRALVAGRGIGEVPLWQQSKVFQMIAPFQLEVTNLWHIFGDMKKDRDIGGIWLILLFNWLFNNAYEEVTNDRIVFDPIDAIASSLRDGNELFSAETGGRLAGEVLSNLPLGQTIATLVPEYDMEITIPGTEKELYTLPSRKKLFGDNDPTRYGSGILLAKAMQDPIYKLLPPLGGSQLKKTIEGATALKKGEVSKNDEIKFLVEKNPENIIKGLAFGQYAFDEAGDYYDKGRRKLTEKQSTEIRKSKDPQTAYETLMVKRRMESVDRKIKDLLKDEELSEKERNQAITKELRKKIQEIKTTSIYTDTEKASMVLKIQGEILKYK